MLNNSEDEEDEPEDENPPKNETGKIRPKPLSDSSSETGRPDLKSCLIQKRLHKHFGRMALNPLNISDLKRERKRLLKEADKIQKIVDQMAARLRNLDDSESSEDLDMDSIAFKAMRRVSRLDAWKGKNW